MRIENVHSEGRVTHLPYELLETVSSRIINEIQQALNAIRGEIERVDDETKWAALELMLSTSNSVVALAKKMVKPETKTVTRTIAVPKTKIVKQQTPPQTTPKDTERTDFTPIRPQPPLPNQRNQ
ncbi:hypothetical protein [Zhongshania sp.]|jgi:hypothetical protein|uniref:hypothetical protein n=1 Tax=Zhongshania sp. TaxID=1971902 RepID=UPI0039E52A52